MAALYHRTEIQTKNRLEGPLSDCKLNLDCLAMCGFITNEDAPSYLNSAKGNGVALAGHQSAGLQRAEGT